MAISLANSSYSPTRLGLPLDEKGPQQKQSMWHRLGLRRWLGRDDRDPSPDRAERRQSSPLFPHNHHHSHHNHHNHRASSADNFPRAKQDNLTRRISRKVGVGLPRSTNKRQDSEHRDRLAPAEPDHRRAQSADRHPLSVQRTRTHSPPPAVGPRLSAPEVQWLGPTLATTVDDDAGETNNESDLHAGWENPSYPDVTIAPSEIETDLGPEIERETRAPVPASGPLQDDLEMELEQRWILNLSMHFRDNSGREKFFVTYAETPTKWRRVTISMDYRGAPPDSLERDLEELRYQRDKCARIYESIRESLAEIQFYDTVTNLKVETLEGRLHVHVTEDVNEIIPYPPIASIRHLRGARCVPEHLLHFDSHLSGFVYKVQLGGRPYIKKEIPGPDTVDEFLYEINALHALNGAPNVIRVEGIVVDDQQEVVKGLLISYAEQGALVDMLYEQRGQISFARRERWAKQIVQGLCEIHESGYVQGDFTLSNIVVDADDDAHIIDINRRGCPVGWEPPEIAAKIESNQRISMYIGVKTDLYQLGMTLWALATGEDEPERQPRPLVLGYDVDVPDYYRRLVDICLSPMPRHRLGAKELLHFFPPDLLLRRARPLSRVAPQEYTSAPFIPTRNGFLPLAPVESPHQYRRKDSYEQQPPKPQGESRPQSLLAENRDEGKRSTITLADSTADTDFAPRHSSASTLNHDEPQSTAQCWDRSRYSFDEPRPEPTPDQKVQNAVPVFWANNMDNGTRANVGEQSSLLDPTTSEDNSASAQDQPLSIPQEPSVPVQSTSKPIPDDDNVSPPTRKQVSFKSPTGQDSHSTASLLLSALPINPAHNISKHKSLPSIRKKAQTYDKKRDLGSVSSLAESRLPINPALGLSQRRSLPAIPRSPQPQTPATAAAESELIRQTLITFLSESQLPINPAFSEKIANLP